MSFKDSGHFANGIAQLLHFFVFAFVTDMMTLDFGC
jgi:hypothetical protein